VFVSQQSPDEIVGYHVGSNVPFERIGFKGDPLAITADNQDNILMPFGDDLMSSQRHEAEDGAQSARVNRYAALSARSVGALLVADFVKNTVFVYPAGRTKSSLSFNAKMDAPIFGAFAIRSRFFQVNQNNCTAEGFFSAVASHLLGFGQGVYRLSRRSLKVGAFTL
jgi:hypothetical protein